MDTVGHCFELDDTFASSLSAAAADAACATAFRGAAPKSAVSSLGADLENASLLALRIDRDGRIVQATPGAAQLLAYPQEHLMRASLLDLINPNQKAAVQHILRSLASGVQEEQACIELIGGLAKSRWVELTFYANTSATSGDRRTLVIGYDVTKWVESENNLKEKTLLDPLTGMGNRTLMRKLVSENIFSALRANSKFAIALLDLDGFKKINDTLGHDVGDSLLKEVAARIKNSVRSQDALARMGGDEFVLLLPTVSDEESGAAVGERIVRAFQQPFNVGALQLRVTTSVGLAFFDQQNVTESILLKRADLAMYKAKERGKNQFCIYSSDMERQLQSQVDTEQNMFAAVQNGEFSLSYQPIFDPSTKEVVSAEALMRWQHLGQSVSPAVFVPIAEQNGLIHLLGRWALRSACTQIAMWDEKGIRLNTVAVNISPVQLLHPKFIDTVKAAVQDAGINPERLTLEITEGALIADPDYAETLLNELRTFGVTFSVDDFGTGYSSLSYLQRYPLSALKIDRSFVQGMLNGHHSRAIVSALVSLGRELGLKVVAEGVETDAQRQALANQGCHFAQGWLVAPALPPDEFTRQLKEGALTLKQYPSRSNN